MFPSFSPTSKQVRFCGFRSLFLWRFGELGRFARPVTRKFISELISDRDGVIMEMVYFLQLWSSCIFFFFFFFFLAVKCKGVHSDMEDFILFYFCGAFSEISHPKTSPWEIWETLTILVICRTPFPTQKDCIS